MSDSCLTCGGFIPEEGVAYGYGGKLCHCYEAPPLRKRASQSEIKPGELIAMKLREENDKLKAENKRLKGELDKFQLVAGNTYEYFDEETNWSKRDELS